jgi:hypothetical protein
MSPDLIVVGEVRGVEAPGRTGDRTAVYVRSRRGVIPICGRWQRVRPSRLWAVLLVWAVYGDAAVDHVSSASWAVRSPSRRPSQRTPSGTPLSLLEGMARVETWGWDDGLVIATPSDC